MWGETVSLHKQAHSMELKENQNGKIKCIVKNIKQKQKTFKNKWNDNCFCFPSFILIQQIFTFYLSK